MTQISMAVVDGQRTFADALASRLAAEPDMLVAVIANSVAATRRLLVGRPVGVVLLDSGLPEGFDLTAELAQIQAGTPQPTRVIMLGTVPEAARIVEALRAGIAGWVPKEDSIQHLLEVIHGVMRDEIWLPPTTMGPVLRLLLHERDMREASQEHPLASLTPREREVLSYLADGIGRREVAERMQLSANTIRSHLQNLMAKLEVHSSLEAVALARRANAHDAASRAAWS
jgi:two-component system NarL family response regulator